jgi:transposase-like protein
MEQVPRQQYTKEFREQAVRLVLEQQVTIPEAARRLAMSGRTLERWVGRARQGQLTHAGGEPTTPSRSWKQSYPGSSGISLRPGWSATS